MIIFILLALISFILGIIFKILITKLLHWFFNWLENKRIEKQHDY